MTAGDLAWCFSCVLSSVSKGTLESEKFAGSAELREAEEAGTMGNSGRSEGAGGGPGAETSEAVGNSAPPVKSAGGRPSLYSSDELGAARASAVSDSLSLLLCIFRSPGAPAEPEARFYISWAICELFGLLNVMRDPRGGAPECRPLLDALLTTMASDQQCAVPCVLGVNHLITTKGASVASILGAHPRFWPAVNSALRACLSELRRGDGPSPGVSPPTIDSPVGEAVDESSIPVETLLHMLASLVTNVYAGTRTGVDPAVCASLLCLTRSASLELAEAAVDALGTMAAGVSESDLSVLALSGAVGALSALLTRLLREAPAGSTAARTRLGTILDKIVEVLRMLSDRVAGLDTPFGRAECEAMRVALEFLLSEAPSGAGAGPPACLTVAEDLCQAMA